jgi:kumamolisin
MRKRIMSAWAVPMAVLFALAGAAPVLAQTLPGGNVMQMHGMVPQVVKQAVYLRAHSPAVPMTVTVGLRLSHPNALNRFLGELQDPASPLYRHFLTPAEFTQAYGPTTAQVTAVTDFLQSRGIHVTGVSSNRLLIHTEASAGTYEQALGVVLEDYAYHGRTFFAPSHAPVLPVSIAGDVESLIGLSDAAIMRPMWIRGPVTISRKSGNTAAATPSGYSPQQIATVYDWPSITSTASGSGVTIANATAESTNLSMSDLDTFWNQYGLPTHTVNITPVDGTTRSTGGTIETTIDEERSGAMAPGATLDVYDADSATDQDFTDTYNTIVTDNTAQVMTTSWGEPEADASSTTLSTDDSIFKQAAAQGISVFAAAGDNGSSDGTSNPDTADFPSSDPYVLAAGGTTLTLTSSNTRSSEIAWSSGGGAESAVFSEPSWQVGNGVPQNGFRNTSDLAMDADPNTGYSVYEAGSWSVYGGTSFVAPQLAGLWADGVADNGGTRLGQANQAEYGVANSANYANDFYDVTSGSNGAFSAGVGWDHPTGWGTPVATNLIANIVTPTTGGGGVAAPTASNGSVTTAENTAVSGTLSASGPSGAALSFAIVAQPANGSVTLTNASTGAFTYTPNSGFSGTDSFTFDASDSGGTSNTATETVTVQAPTVAAPTASNGSVTTNENKAVSGTLSASGPSGAALSFAIVAQPANGSVTLTNASTGAFTYTPNSGFSGTDSFTFDASDSGGTSNTATETVTVNAVSTGPCPTGYATYTGSLSGSGDYAYQPNDNYYYANRGKEAGLLYGPSGTNFQLYLYQWNPWFGWVNVAAGTGGGADQSVSYYGSSGYYVWLVYSNSGAGAYTFCLHYPGEVSAVSSVRSHPAGLPETPPKSVRSSTPAGGGSGSMGLLGLLAMAAILVVRGFRQPRES